ncbi:hypothetical protein [Umezawaea beigongshangensis]|uniref:hypothetical protein n=1 Tax=Umezawaea beigongshangensis TaxID=2780383 RepID=UPI0018F148CD|nr:hypothetical protein [Umezawaea beigongshangensis]
MDDLAATVVPYLGALATTYGAAVLERVRDDTVDAAAEGSVGLGKELLRKLLSRGDASRRVEDAMVDLAENPEEQDNRDDLLLQVRKLLKQDPELREDLTGVLRTEGVVIAAIGERSFAARDVSGSHVHVGDNHTTT